MIILCPFVPGGILVLALLRSKPGVYINLQFTAGAEFYATLIAVVFVAYALGFLLYNATFIVPLGIAIVRVFGGTDLGEV